MFGWINGDTRGRKPCYGWSLLQMSLLMIGKRKPSTYWESTRRVHPLCTLQATLDITAVGFAILPALWASCDLRGRHVVKGSSQPSRASRIASIAFVRPLPRVLPVPVSGASYGLRGLYGVKGSSQPGTGPIRLRSLRD
jgi:hypothetical protein